MMIMMMMMMMMMYDDDNDDDGGGKDGRSRERGVEKNKVKNRYRQTDR